ncbi:MAG: zinc ribbon domain-containing protein [Propionibacteriaceae bacterium]
MRLLDLQEVDTALSQLQHRRKSLPEHAEAAALQSEKQQSADGLVAAETAVSDLELDARKAESDLEPVRQRRTRNQQRIADGTVGDPKALASLIEEVDHLDRRISELEDAELELLEQLEEAGAERDRLDGVVGEVDERLAEVITRRDAALATIDEGVAAAKAERTTVVADLPADLLAFYDKLAATHGGSGAAALKQRRCTGCRLELNSADLRGYAAAPEDEVLRCEECGRILVRTAESGI